MELRFENNILKYRDAKFELEFPIRDSKKVGDLLIVIFALSNEISEFGQFQNCMAFDLNGNHVWTAEHPTNMTNDYYLQFTEDNKLWNFACFVCELDFSNGKLIDAQFTK